MGEKNINIPMCSEILKGHPYSYRNHLRYLCENFSGIGNVLWRSDYSKGKCYSYKIAPYYFSDEISFYEITDKRLTNFILKELDIKSNNDFKKQYNFLGKYFNAERLKIDLRSCNEVLVTNYRLDSNRSKYLINAINAIQIANGEFNLRLSKNDGRVHTQITNLSKSFRPFLSYDGKKLGEVDISASVPSFLYYILLNWSNTEDSHLSNVINPSKLYYRHYMFLKTLVELDNSELSLFGEKIKSGEFYDCFIEGMHSVHSFDERLHKDEYYLKNVERICNRPFDGDIEDLKAVIKNRFLSMLNAQPANYLNEEAEFNMHFPSILNWIKNFKKINHRYFSHLLLQTESYFMLDIVARKLNNDLKGKVPVFTLHDCIITTEENLEFVESFMKNTLTEALGFTPKMKSKVF